MPDADWSQVVAGPWLAETLKGCAARRDWPESIPALP